MLLKIPWMMNDRKFGVIWYNLMVHLTRSKVANMDAFIELVDKKLGELRVTLLAEFKVALDNFVEEKKAELTLFIKEENTVDVGYFKCCLIRSPLFRTFRYFECFFRSLYKNRIL